MWIPALDRILRSIRGILRSENAYLLPLRFFIGIGWIRAGLEKLIEPAWLDGSALVEFLRYQLAGNLVVFPFYRSWIESIFLPGALALSWVIIAGQLLVGLAVLSGTLTNFALLWGLFMNIQFILAGQVTPSAFYVVIQIILLLGNAGAVLGFDQILGRMIPLRMLVARREVLMERVRVEKRIFLMLMLISVAAGLLAVPFIRDFGPHSVEDTAMILLVLGIFTSLSSLIMVLRLPDSTEAQNADTKEATRPKSPRLIVK